MRSPLCIKGKELFHRNFLDINKKSIINAIAVMMILIIFLPIAVILRKYPSLNYLYSC